MHLGQRLKALRYALIATGAIFLGAGGLLLVWPSGWRWEPHHPFYEQMILGVYATLGVFLLRASRDPLRHASLIWFTVWSSVVHGGIMLAQSFSGPEHHGHLIGDVPGLFLVAGVLGFLMPKGDGV
ncbi:MAG: DUF6632 domain-containing protein [Bdellovibrionota bacterium]